MKNILCSVLVPFFAASAATAAGDADFVKDLAALRADASGPVRAVKPPEPSFQAVIEKDERGEYVRVSGYINFIGTGWMPSNGGYTHINFSGWTTLKDPSGRITSNSVSISFSEGVWANPNQHIFQTVRPNVTVSFYKDGQYAGSTTVSGYISVSGWPSSSFINVSGSGYLEGSLYLTE